MDPALCVYIYIYTYIHAPRRRRRPGKIDRLSLLLLWPSLRASATRRSDATLLAFADGGVLYCTGSLSVCALRQLYTYIQY